MILSEKKTISLPLFHNAPSRNKRHKHQLFPSKVTHFAERGVTFHKQVFETVAGHVPHIAHIRVRYAGDIQQPVPVYFPVRQMAVHLRHALADARFYLPQQIAGGFTKMPRKALPLYTCCRNTLSGCSVSSSSFSRKPRNCGMSCDRRFLSVPTIKKSST